MAESRDFQASRQAAQLEVKEGAGGQAEAQSWQGGRGGRGEAGEGVQVEQYPG